MHGVVEHTKNLQNFGDNIEVQTVDSDVFFSVLKKKWERRPGEISVTSVVI